MLVALLLLASVVCAVFALLAATGVAAVAGAGALVWAIAAVVAFFGSFLLSGRA
jgi:hypothetical protein